MPEAEPAETISEKVTVQAPVPWFSEADERVGAVLSDAFVAAVLAAAMPLLLVSWTAFATTYTLGPVMAMTFWMSAVESVPEAEAAEEGTVRATSFAELYVVLVPM